MLVSEQFYDWSDRRLWAFKRDALLQRPRSRRHRTHSDHGQVRAASTGSRWRLTQARSFRGQWFDTDPENALTITTPATISPSPKTAGPSSRCPKPIQPTVEISTIPSPDQIA